LSAQRMRRAIRWPISRIDASRLIAQIELT
jgi:hypothetical protein